MRKVQIEGNCKSSSTTLQGKKDQSYLNEYY